MLYFPIWKRILIWGLCGLGLLLSLPNGFYTRVEQANDARAALALGAGLNNTEERARFEEIAAKWPSFLPNRLVNLGLDLRGGAHLLGEVRLEEVQAVRLDGYWPRLRDALRSERAVIGTIRREQSPPDQIIIRISNPDAIESAAQTARKIATPILNLTGARMSDIKVRTDQGRLIITFSEAEKKLMDERTMAQSLEIIRNRVDEAGTREPTIQRQGVRRILIQVPGIGSADELKTLIGKTARLSLHPVISQTTNDTKTLGPDMIIVPDRGVSDSFYILEKTPVISGTELIDAQAGFDPQTGVPIVSFRLNVAGARDFGIYTAKNVGALFAIVLDGEIISAATISEPIPNGSAMIKGRFTTQETLELSVFLRAGALPAGIDFLEERTIGPELGQDSIDAGRRACVVAFIAVLLSILAGYGFFGLFANIALILNIGLIFGTLSLIGATLTLPGIAGIVLTIGMAVDANVLVFERIREELKTARGPALAIERGYDRARSAIFDANLTTFITAAILFALGSGPVRGFAITLGIGIITSVFTAYFVTRLLIITWFERRRPRQIKV